MSVTELSVTLVSDCFVPHEFLNFKSFNLQSLLRPAGTNEKRGDRVRPTPCALPVMRSKKNICKPDCIPHVGSLSVT